MNSLKENPYCRALIKINGESDLPATRRDKIFPSPPPFSFTNFLAVEWREGQSTSSAHE